MKIGIYGGSFNPPHLSHQNIVSKLLEYGYVDKIIVVPVGDYYKKQNLISFKHRYNMIRILFKNVSSFENQDRQVYTYQTLDYFQKKYPNDKIYFITGLELIKRL